MTMLFAAAAGEEAGALDLILPAAAELVYGAIAFFLIFAVLKAKVWPSLSTALDERSAAIQGKMEEAERTRAEAEEAKRRFDASIADAQGQAGKIIDEAKATAEALRRDIVAKAEAEAQAIVARGQAEAAGERERTLQELRSQVGQMSVALAGKIVEKELDSSAHQDLVDTYIQNLAGTN